MLVLDDAAIDQLTLHSRSVLAGYDPEVLFTSGATVVGAGALGQNVALNLALAGVGSLLIVDFDDFEPHNATRSPLFPAPAEQSRWGMQKARVVGQKLKRLMTARDPRVYAAAMPIQQLGDAAVEWADVVISAVDNPGARDFLAERCRLHGRPLIEAGFHASELNLSVFGDAPGDACYRCHQPEVEGAFSCRRYAAEAAAEGVIPAIQNGAAVLAGLQAEAAIQWLHGDRSHVGKRFYVDIRRMTLDRAELEAVRGCPAPHWVERESPVLLSASPETTLRELFLKAEDALGKLEELRLPHDFIMCITCTKCRQWVDARCPEWRWLMDPRCRECGGPFPLSQRSAFDRDFRVKRPFAEVAELSCAAVGLPAGSSVEAVGADDARRLVRLPGGIEDHVVEIRLDD